MSPLYCLFYLWGCVDLSLWGHQTSSYPVNPERPLWAVSGQSSWQCGCLNIPLSRYPKKAGSMSSMAAAEAAVWVRSPCSSHSDFSWPPTKLSPSLQQCEAWYHQMTLLPQPEGPSYSNKSGWALPPWLSKALRMDRKWLCLCEACDRSGRDCLWLVELETVQSDGIAFLDPESKLLSLWNVCPSVICPLKTCDFHLNRAEEPPASHCDRADGMGKDE